MWDLPGQAQENKAFMHHGSPFLPLQAPASIQHLWSIPRAQQPGPPRPLPAQQLGTILLHPAHVLRETEAQGAFQLSQRWAAPGWLLPCCSLPPAACPCQQEAGWERQEQGFPALCSAPAPSAHGPHVTSCSFFAPPTISAPASAHAAALPTSSCFSHLHRTSGAIPPRPPRSQSRQLLPGVLGAAFPGHSSSHTLGKGSSR